MKAEELRIGNWVNHKKVKLPIRINANNLLALTNGSDLYEPIPLTPEILEKCGFVCSGDIKEGIYWWETEWPIIGELSTCDKERGNYVFDCNTDTLRITSLHQLQNLYFALTNTELTITF